MPGRTRATVPTPRPGRPAVVLLSSRTSAVLAAGALCLGLSACSSGPSKEEYLSSAEEICTQANTALDDLAEPETPEQVTEVLDEAIAVVDGAVDELEGLDAPDGDGDELERTFLEPVRGQVDALEEIRPQVEEAVESGDPEALGDLPEPASPEADVEAMRAYGFDSCVDFAGDEA